MNPFLHISFHSVQDKVTDCTLEATPLICDGKSPDYLLGRSLYHPLSSFYLYILSFVLSKSDGIWHVGSNIIRAGEGSKMGVSFEICNSESCYSY